LLSGANSKAIIGAEFACPGIINMTADDTYLELGNQSVVTGATSLQTGTGQKMVCGNEVQLVGNITVSSADAELHMGSTADIDGTVALSGANSIMSVGNNSSLAQTLALSSTNIQFIAGHTVQVGGNITTPSAHESSLVFGSDADLDGTVEIDGGRMLFKVGGQSNLASSLTTTTGGGGSRVTLGQGVVIGGDITISQADMIFEAESAWDFNGVINIDATGDRCKMTLGTNGNLASTFTCAGSICEIDIGGISTITGAVLYSGSDIKAYHGSQGIMSSTFTVSGPRNTIALGDLVQVVGNYTVSEAANTISAGSYWNFDGTINITSAGDQCKMTLGALGNLASTFTCTGQESEITMGGKSTIVGAFALAESRQRFITNSAIFSSTFSTSESSYVDLGSNTQIVGDITIANAGVEFYAGARWNFDGVLNITSAGDQCKMKLGALGNLAGALTLSGDHVDFYHGDNCQIVGNIAHASPGGSLRTGAAANWDGTVLLTGTSSLLYVGPRSDLAQTLGLTSNGIEATFDSNTAINGIVTMSGNAGQLDMAATTFVVAAVNVSGTDCIIRAKAQTDFGGIVTLSGAGCSLICENGCNLDGVVMSGDKGLFNGGGWDTHVNGLTSNDAIDITGDYCTVKDVQAQTSAGGGQSYKPIHVHTSGDWTLINHCYVPTSDTYGIFVNDTPQSVTVSECLVVDTDSSGILINNGDGHIVVNNTIGHSTLGPAGQAIQFTGTNGIVSGNRVSISVTDGMYLGGTGKNNVVGNWLPLDLAVASDSDHCIVGNSTDTGVTGTTSTCTVASNETY